MLAELYETKFGIYDHLGPTGPLSSVAMQEAERHIGKFLYEGYLRNFLMRDLAKKLGMSFDQYLERPKYELELIDGIVAELDKKRNAVNEDLLNELTSTTDKPKS